MQYTAPRSAEPEIGLAPDDLSAEPLGGRLLARPGRQRPNLRSTRRQWGADLATGQPASALPRLLGSLYAMCSGAHRVTAQAAVEAAQGREPDTATFGQRQADLQRDTLREHVRRIWLDWPRALLDEGRDPLAGADLAALRSCPVLPERPAPGAPEAATMAGWLADHVFGLHPIDWLERWSADPAAWLGRWAASAGTWPAELLAACHRDAATLAGPPAPLHAHASPDEMRRLARHLRDDPGFALAPLWRGHCAETGPWTRLSDPLARAGAGARAGTNAWLRLGARIADMAQGVLAAPSRPWLVHGALSLAPGEGIAWSEMARGLLVHWVQLDESGPTADARVAACRVLAPTEWNFHPHGAVAQSLALMSPGVRPARVRLLAAAFDPCVDIAIEAARRTEARHA
jgi:hypothetical protein